jgi:hypothetical protein
MKALYYLGNYAYELNANGVDESESSAEFGRDTRTGRVAISTLDSLIRVLDMPGRTLVIVENEKLGKSTGVPRDVIGFVQTHCVAVQVSSESQLTVWQCGSR